MSKQTDLLICHGFQIQLMNIGDQTEKLHDGVETTREFLF